jgi:biotin transporter BioY
MTIKRLAVMCLVGVALWAGIGLTAFAFMAQADTVEASVWDGVVVVDGLTACPWNLPCYDSLTDPNFEG